VLESTWKADLLEKDGIAIAIKALATAISRDTATGDGMDVAVVNKKGVKRIKPEEIKTVLEAL
ncbi:MAG: proteasome subunit beta, partial [Candidatus Heimdallarchaeota archaeon]|nr:proteasome subunit beta [Candidatus Heimdallarchaeota archaeon]MCK4253142.1 proteasome subunit beta [Candidatus Heimdallarchaeota archaeon]